jgi:hypothetical protein
VIGRVIGRHWALGLPDIFEREQLSVDLDPCLLVRNARSWSVGVAQRPLTLSDSL